MLEQHLDVDVQVVFRGLILLLCDDPDLLKALVAVTRPFESMTSYTK